METDIQETRSTETAPKMDIDKRYGMVAPGRRTRAIAGAPPDLERNETAAAREDAGMV